MLHLTLKKELVTRPLPLWQALFYFGIPALLFRICVYNWFPALMDSGMAQFPALLMAFMTPLAILLFASVVMYWRDGNPLACTAFTERFRLYRMSCRDWLWTTGAFVVGYLGSGALLFTAVALARIPALAPPSFLPSYLTPKGLPSLVLTDFMGVHLAGNWGFVFAYIMLLVLNIVGEEFWWRGYIFPRQELVHGKWTWLIHGTLWMLFHMPIYPWNFFVLLPTCLSVAFVAQRLKNTWPGMIIHFVTNGIVLLPILLGVLNIGH